MNKLNISFFSKLLIFASIFGLILLIIILTNTISFNILKNKSEIDKNQYYLVEANILRHEFYIDKDTNKLITSIQNIENLKKSFIDNKYTSNPYFNIQINNYILYLNKYYEYYKIRGINENMGTEGEFRNSIHNLESIINKQNNNEILVMILQIRRREKDYLLRKNEIYIKSVNNLLEELKAKINDKDISSETTRYILENINNYQTNFIKLTTYIKKIDTIDTKIKITEKKLFKIINNLVKEKNDDAEFIIKIQDYIYIVSIILIILVSYFLSKSITLPIKFLFAATEKISFGDYNYRAEIISNDEIGKFAFQFNNMVNKLQIAYEQIENDKNKLELRVEERTEYLIKTIEEHKKISKDLEVTKKELLEANYEIGNTLEKEQELNNLKTKFVQTVSHEYRTPLTVILNSTYLLEQFYKNLQPDNFLKQLDRVKDSVNYMKNLLDSLLTIEKLDYGKININKVNIDIVLYIKSYIKDLEANYPKFKFRFNKQIDSYFVDIDIKIFNTILINIINNSVIYSGTSNEIIINIYKDKFSFLIEIIDNGIGILPQEMKYLFEPFFRGSNISNIQGIGLGLSIARKYAEILDFNIKLFSEKDKGTRVILEMNFE